ncbi:MAG: class IV adenylate cyclase [Desulfurococcales archaeon]|nr:class IV adenylate cyclase [Desulfurococcales archaeon]
MGLPEREVKVRIECRLLHPLRSDLEKLGFKCKGPIAETDIYYSHPCKDFIESDEALRLRFISERVAKLTYKGPRRFLGKNVKEREEIEIEVGNPAALESILSKLGFKPALRVEKSRTYCNKDDITVTLDRVEGLGCFLEVEAPDETTIDEVLESVGLSNAEKIELTYAEMIGGFKAGKRTASIEES